MMFQDGARSELDIKKPNNALQPTREDARG
jgi:hypothetical protein